MESKWDALDPNAAARRRGVLRSAIGVVQSLSWHWLVALLLACAWSLHLLQGYLQQWRAASLKRDTRRRYGIPDDDHRPFHIAAQAAAIARKQQQLALREAEKKAAAQRALEQPARTSAFDRHPAQQPQLTYSASSLGARAPYSYNSSREINGLPRCTSQYLPRTDNWTSRYDPRPSVINASSSRPSTALLNVASNARPRAVSRKHVIGGPGPLIDEPATHRRARKRQVDSDSEVIDSDRDRTKRARQYINLDGDDDAEMADATDTATEDEMDTDTVAAPAAGHRTLKRGRSDAGSVFGDSVRERKMRRKGPSSTGRTRGKKRAVETSGSEDEASGPANKRGRLSSGDEGDSDEGMHEESDEEAQETQESTQTGTATETSIIDPVCGDREIGDTWTEGEVEFKVGEDGRRLRLAHVKSVHTRAVKGKDVTGSPIKPTGLTPIQHTVVVERWLNDEEFAQMKSRKELAWGYDTDEEGSVGADEIPLTSTTTKKDLHLTVTISDDSTSTQSGGKILLWDTGSRFSSRPSTPGGSTQPSPNSGVSSSKLQNPFHSVSAPALGRRVTSSAGGIQVPPLRYSRSFSKWEKMEAEAEALERLRKGDREEQKKKEAAAVPPAPAPTPATASSSLFVPKPSDATPAAASQPSAAPQVAATPAPANLSFAPKPAATETTTSKPVMATFSLGTPAATTPAAESAAPKPVFSFGPATGTTPAAPTAAPTASAAPAPAPTFPAFNIPTNPLNIAPGGKPATAAPSAPGFSFGPAPAAAADKKDQPAASGLAAFAKPAGSTGGLASISFGPSAPSATPTSTPATVTPAAPAATGFSFGPAAASGASASRPAFPGLGATNAGGAATPATAAPASNLFSFGPAATPAATDAAKPAASGFSFGPTAGAPAPAPAMPSASGASSGFNFAGSAAAPKPTGFSFGPTVSSAPTPVTSNASAGGAPAAPGFSFGPAPATSTPAAGQTQTQNLFAPAAPAAPANLTGGNPFAPSGGNPFGSANGGTLNAQGRPMRGRSSLSGKPPLGSGAPGTTPSPAPGATGSANLFSFASTPGATAPAAGAPSPFGFPSAGSAPAPGAAAQPSPFSFGPAAGVTQQPAQNPSPFGGSAFSFGQK